MYGVAQNRPCEVKEIEAAIGQKLQNILRLKVKSVSKLFFDVGIFFIALIDYLN